MNDEELRHRERHALIVEGLIVVDPKAVVRLDRVHEAQLISYLRTTGLRGGLLINFRVPVLQQGVRRVILSLRDLRDLRG